MNKKTQGKILDIAAAVIVSPLAAYAKAAEIIDRVEGSETYAKTLEAAKSAGNDIKTAAKKAYESEQVQKGISAVKDTAKKVSESEAYTKAKDAARTGIDKAKEGIDTVASKLGFQTEGKKEPDEGLYEDEEESFCGSSEASCCEEGKEEDCCSEGGIENAIDEVDLSGIITEDDAKEEIPEE